VPGSHTWGLLPITGLTGDMDSITQVLGGDQATAFKNKIANELTRGYASFHHPLMIHGSYANNSDRPRRAVVLNAMGHSTLGNTADYDRLEALRNFPVMKQDMVLDSHFFPLLFAGDRELKSMSNDAIPKVNSAKLYSVR
jgi:ectoine hydroxylase-related dioxygenase (phytanoyl-CoA dioxygenase family)